MTDGKKSLLDRLVHIRAHLEKKNKQELIALLLDLVREMDEPTRQRFWQHLAPPGMATADLRYPSAKDFLSELESFIDAVAEGDYYDEEAESYDEDDNFYGYDEYDPEDHKAIQALNGFFYEAGSYFDSGQFDVAAQAYQMLLDLALDDTFETLGLSTPMGYVEQDEREAVRRYFIALQASCSQDEFYDQALSFLARHENQADVDHFLELVGDEYPALQEYIEAWAEKHLENKLSTPMDGLAFQLRMLLHLYEQDKRLADTRSMWGKFRHMYPACYAPLLADRQDAGDWKSVLLYAQEALTVARSSNSAYYFRDNWVIPDKLTLRGYLARAYSALGDTVKAFEAYRPAVTEVPSFETYAQARRLANAISSQKGMEFTREAIRHLHQKEDLHRYLLCQVYLSENQFDDAYALVASLTGYQELQVSKLVAKAHLLAAFGPSPDERMESNLRDLYARVEQGENETLCFLRDALPQMPAVLREVAIERTENIYHRLMQTHIDNGRKTYATGAYYCAMLGEIALHEGRLAAFRQWHEKYMEAYKRFRAVRAEMDMKVSPIIRSKLTN